LLIAVEGVARWFGLHTPVLYERTSYGYRVKPSQDIRRFGNRVFYNSYGLRSEPMSPSPAPGVMRILCLGDSITNGGTITDQSETYPYLLERDLREDGINAEVLNASAGGWALENEQGWLMQNGTFGARVLVLQVATHDLFQQMALSSTVDGHPSFPSRAPLLASKELIARYVLPRLFPSLRVEDPGAAGVHPDLPAVRSSLQRIEAMVDLARHDGAATIVLQVEQPVLYEAQDALTRGAKQLLESELRTHDVAVLKTAEVMAARGDEALFRDSIHPNPQGNRILAEAVARAVRQMK
jgi:lysophospholipase L1-like esterase